MRKALLGSLLLGAVTAFAGVTAGGDGTAAQGPTVLAVDTDPDGNTNTSVGAIEDCISVSLGDVFDIDIVVQEVQNLVAWESPFVYRASILRVTGVDVRRFLTANSGSNVVDVSASVPNSSGRYYMGAGDIGKAPDSGEGILARLTLEAVGTGVSEAELRKIDFNGDGSPDLGPTLTSLTFDVVEHVGDTDGDELFDGDISQGRIAVDTSCSETSPPTTPPPTTPPPTPPAGGDQPPGADDSDDDGVAAASDQCPDTQAAASVDASGCSEEQLEEAKEEEKERLIEQATAGLNLRVSLETVVVGGSTDVLAVFADQNDEPVPGVEITFKIEEQPGEDANLEGETDLMKLSADDGVAEARLGVGSAPGDIVVSASAEGETETVTVTVVEAAVSASDSPVEETPGTNPGFGGPGAGAGSDSGNGGLSAWIIAVVVGGLLTMGMVTLGAWRFARNRRF